MRAPKPPEHDASPRFRVQAPPRRATLDALSQLTSSELESEHMLDYINEIGTPGNDRAAAIILARHLEDTLALALLGRLGVEKNRLNELIGFERPLGSFDNKIRFGYAIGLLTEETRSALDVIRSVRNAFAHALIPIRFETKEVASACALTTIPAALPPTSHSIVPESLKPIKNPTPWLLYQHACTVISHNFLVAAGFYVRLTGTPPPESV